MCAVYVSAYYESIENTFYYKQCEVLPFVTIKFVVCRVCECAHIEHILQQTTHLVLCDAHPPFLSVFVGEAKSYVCVCAIVRACVRACVRECVSE